MKKVYLDHCVVSSLSNDPLRNWREVGLGTTLSTAIRDQRAEVITSPTEIMEIFLTAKTDLKGNLLDYSKEEQRRLDLRMRAAKNVLEMIEAKRLIEAYEFVVVREFLDNLDRLAPGAVLTRMHFDLFANSHVQIFLGALGLLASYRYFGGVSGLERMKRAKITSQLLHSRFIRDPDQFVAAVVDCASNYRTTTDEIWAEFEVRSLDDMLAEIEQNQANSVPIKNATKQRLQREKCNIARAYGAAELGECLLGVFQEMCYLISTFDLDIIKQRWGDILGNGAPAPDYLGPAGQKCNATMQMRIKALETIFCAFSRDRLFVSSLPTAVVLGELEFCLNAGKLPSGGLTFDSQHAVNLIRCDVFVTHDKRLANLARRAAKLIQETGKHKVSVATDAGELAAALRNP